LIRQKRRYLALQIDSEGAISRKEFMYALWDAVVKLYGEYGASLTNMTLIDFDLERKSVVIRTSLFTVSMVRASLASITSLAGVEAAVHILAVSGTTKALRKKLKW
jgi:ribonuclease P/MRP protein subunit POP5